MATSEQVTAVSHSANGTSPRVPVFDIAVGLYDHYQSIAEIKAYYGVLAIYALARTAVDHGHQELMARTEQILRRFPDDIDHPYYNFPSYRIGGIAQSFMVAQGWMSDRRELLAEYADEMMTAPRDRNGIVSMPGHPEGRIWIDAAMAATPFLLYAGLALGRADYVEEAINQTVWMHDEFLDRSTGLLHQCKGFIGPGVVSTDHWGRGNGWGILALAELVAGLPVDHPRRADVEQRFVALAPSLLPHQSPNGLWRQEIPMAAAWEESSGTGLIVYALGLGLRTGVLHGSEWLNAVKVGLVGLARSSINPDYSTENSCPGTLCPGSGSRRGTPQAYVGLRAPVRDEPHSFAAFMLALSVADTVGVSELTLRTTPQTTTFFESGQP